MFRSILLFLIVLLTGALLLIAGGTARSLAANQTVNCVPGPTEIVCTIADDAGIGAVQVEEATAQGTNLAVNEAYAACPNDVTVKWMPLVPNYKLTVTACGAAPVARYYFAGLDHQPLGEATPSLTALTLATTGFDREGDDGLAVAVGEASLWSALLLPEAPAARGTFKAAIFTAGARAPVAELQFGTYMTDVIIYLPDNRHNVDLYRGNTLVHSDSGLSNGESHASLLSPFCEGNSDLTTCAPRLTFGIDPLNNRAYWEIHPLDPISVTVPTGVVSADRLRFGEGTDNRNPLIFERVELSGTELPRLRLFDEVVRAPLAESSVYLPALQGGGGAADPYGFEALTDFMESDPPMEATLQIGDYLSARVVGTGDLITEMVVDPIPGDETDEGSPDPAEPPVDSLSRQVLRVFNTGNKKEFEIEVGGDLLAELNRLVQGSGANPGPGGALGVDGLLVRERRSPGGWSNGVDNRVYLSGTTWWPWRTIVHFSNNCSGTLVGPRHILTAAHCINKRGTNQWYSFTATPGRDGTDKPFGDTTMDPNPQPGDPFRWYFTPAGWRDPQYNAANCAGSCFAASRHDWGLIIIPEYLGYQTGWMGYVARPASQLNYQSHFNRGYPVCNSSNGNSPAGCDFGELFGDVQTCDLGNYSVQDGDGWNRLIRNSCDLNGGHSGSPVYHYYYDPYLGKTVPVVAMVEIWEHCFQCTPSDDTPNTARRLTPSSIDIITFFRQWKP